MDGRELERLLSLIETNSDASREEILRYVTEHKEKILADLQQKGESEIPVSGGDKVILRLAA